MFKKLIPPPIVPSDAVFTKAKSLRPFMKNVNIVVLVFEKIETNWTKDNHSVHVLRVADETGSVLLTLYDQIGQAAKPGDILRIMCGFVTLFKKSMRLACKVGSVHRIGRVRMVAHQQPDMSKIIWEGTGVDDLRAILPGDDAKLQELASEMP
jgi:hypothetical protein